MKIFKLMKKRVSVRGYSKKKVPIEKLNKILEAAIWGPSLSGFQVGFYVVIKKGAIKNKISKILEENLKKLGVIGRVAYIPSTMKALKSCSILIAVYASTRFKRLISTFAKYTEPKNTNNIYVKLAEQAEICAVSASIQNMILLIEELGLASCWLHTPLFCEQEINKLLSINKKLIAFLAIGYPKKKELRAPRLPIKETIWMIE